MGKKFNPIALYKWTCLNCKDKKKEKKGRKQFWNPKYKANRGIYKHKRDFHKGEEKITILFDKKFTKTEEVFQFTEFV